MLNVTTPRGPVSHPGRASGPNATSGKDYLQSRKAERGFLAQGWGPTGAHSNPKQRRRGQDTNGCDGLSARADAAKLPHSAHRLGCRICGKTAAAQAVGSPADVCRGSKPEGRRTADERDLCTPCVAKSEAMPCGAGAPRRGVLSVLLALHGAPVGFAVSSARRGEAIPPSNFRGVTRPPVGVKRRPGVG